MSEFEHSGASSRHRRHGHRSVVKHESTGPTWTPSPPEPSTAELVDPFDGGARLRDTILGDDAVL